MTNRSPTNAAASERISSAPAPASTTARLNIPRAAVATLAIAGYMAIGFALGLNANAYLLLGIPVTIAFQRLVARRPLRALWLRDAPWMGASARSVAATVLVGVAPAILTIRGAQDGDLVLAAYGLAAMVGAAGAVVALRAITRDAVRATVRACLINGAILVAVMVVFRLVSGGFHGNVGGAIATAIISIATYLPAVFVMEEVLFRGALDPYLHRSSGSGDRASAVYGSALWGLWHLPVMSVDLGLATIPYLVGVHTALGVVLVSSWRRTGNLAAPGIAHAVADALRNAVAVL